jgi:hypothetical protein
LALPQNLSKCLILLVGDFRQHATEALALRALGMRVFVAGMGSAAVRRALEAQGVAVSGLVRSRQASLDAALERMGGCDAVLVVTPGWERELEALRHAEIEAAAMDGRPRNPIVALYHDRTEPKSRGHQK